jgi:predicted esterase
LKKKSMFFLLALTLSMLMVSVSFQQAQAVVTVQQITGKLGGADYLLRIPSNWNGELIVYCRGYSHLLSDVDMITPANGFNTMVQNGFAFAESNYGAGGVCIKEAIIRTHQLTEYIKDNYPVTGKVYLVGISMGGNIVLELGAKYPSLFDGVLDVAGATNMIDQYNEKVYCAGIASDVDLAAAVVANGGVNPPFPSPTIADFRTFCQLSSDDIALTCGGTPDEKTKAYERISPQFSSVDVTIPTITIHGTADAYVPYSQSIDFMNKVTATGHADMYRLYKVNGGQHANPPVLAQIPVNMQRLIAWVEHGIAPIPSIT